MRNTPPMWQHFVSHATRSIIKQCLIMHYMDDILLAHRDSATSLTCLKQLLANLTKLGLHVATDKVQYQPPFEILGYKISSKIRPLRPTILIKPKCTINELQQLCEHVNWLKHFLPIPLKDLNPCSTWSGKTPALQRKLP